MPRSIRPLAQGDRVRAKGQLDMGVRNGAQGTVCRVGVEKHLISFDRGPKLWVERSQVAKITPRKHAPGGVVVDDMTLVAPPGPPGAMRCVPIGRDKVRGASVSDLIDAFMTIARQADEELRGGAEAVEVLDPACRGSALVALGIERAAMIAELSLEIRVDGPHVWVMRPGNGGVSDERG